MSIFFIYNKVENFNQVIISKKRAEKNLEIIKKTLNKKICLMVKSNAYGHGINTIINITKKYVDFFGVANINEAINVRKLCDNKILIVGKTFAFKQCLENNISLAIESISNLKSLVNFLKNNPSNNCIKIHLKVNSGMNRLGFSSFEKLALAFEICEKNNIFVEGIFTHFSTLDCDLKYFNFQLNRFQEFLKKVPKRFDPIVHIGGSGILNKKINLDYSMARIGIAFYGYQKGINVKPILKIKSKIIKVFEVEKGERVGYSNGLITSQKMKIAIVPLGYGDGVCRNLSNKAFVKINNKKFKIVGNVCMDMFFVDITGENFEEGHEVVVFDNAKKWAQILGTIPYEILTNFSLVRWANKF